MIDIIAPVAMCYSHARRRLFQVRPIPASMDVAHRANACVAPIPSGEFAFTPRRPNIKWFRKSPVAGHIGARPNGRPRWRRHFVDPCEIVGIGHFELTEKTNCKECTAGSHKNTVSKKDCNAQLAPRHCAGSLAESRIPFNCALQHQ